MTQRKIYKECSEYKGDKDTCNLNEVGPGVPEELKHRLERNFTLFETVGVAIQPIYTLSPFVFKGDRID